MADAVLWPVALGLLGLVFGSFIATLAIRWPAGRSTRKGRSECDGCGAQLRAIELVPVVSHLLQRGRCRRCGAMIAPSHLVTELLAGAIGVTAGWIAPGLEGVAGAVFGWGLLALAAIDLAAFWLPDPLVAGLALAGLAGGLAGWGPPLLDRAIGGVAGIGSLWLVAAAYRRLRGRTGLGGGDPKLFGAIGLWLGWRALPMTLLAASVVGLLAVLLLHLAGRRLGMADRLPFGTLLAAAAFPIWCLLAMAG